MIALGVPAFGLTFAVTFLTAFLPDILHDTLDPVLIGLLIGAEGFFGLFVPLIFGVLADRSKTVAGRWKYVAPATAAMAAALVLIGVFNKNVWIVGWMVALFYLGYFAYLAPYWATYPDLIEDGHAGRARSAESSWRVGGAFLALVSGGFLLAAWTPLPFIISAVLTVGVTVFLAGVLRNFEHTPIKTKHETLRKTLRDVWDMWRADADIRNLLIANGFWNAALQAIQAFTVVFFTQGLHRSEKFVSGVIFPVAAIGILAMAPLAGRLADRKGHYRVLLIASLVYGMGALAPVFWLSTWVIFIVPLVAGAAATIMTLPNSALQKLLTNQPHGAISGVFGISRGFGTFLGPLLAGTAITSLRWLFPDSGGYAAVWLSVSLMILISIFFLTRIKDKAF
jgi:Na+/melibiose symporter-like transporter